MLLTRVTAGRPVGVDDHYVFVRLRAPLIGPLSNATVNSVVVEAAKRAGLDRPSIGPHMLRHSAATALLEEGMSLPALGALLRHRNIDTTAVYAKVDTRLLASVSQPWPEEVLR